METQAQDLFTQAREQDPGERPGFLDAACAGKPELRHEVERLLADAERADSFFADTLVTDGADEPRSGLTEHEGDVIGPYTLRQQIGEGGFGTVWMAEQKEPISRMVALKVIKMGMDTKQVLARFEAERQAVAMMDHPNIAQVLDAGATPTGRPWFAMELVKGIPITQFCDEKGLGTTERLALFGDVCAAINHAHQKGIIHRDIKPNNVMVTVQGDKAVVKVIDFGIAKATQGKLIDQTLFTRFEQFIGTPVYMSPEQASLSGMDIDTRSDIYALGILLYELLVGRPPFDARTLMSAGYEEMRRIIREEEPPKPSIRLSTVAGEERAALARLRKVDPAKLSRLVASDLDWIVMKAIDKDRTRRYETANAFAQDIVRFLADEPVTATPPSAGYKFRKFARRHRGAFGVAAAMVILLLAGIAATTWQAVRATAAEKLAGERLMESEAAREDAEAISTYMSEVFQSPDPTRDGRTITVAETLDKAAEKLETDLTDQPERRAQLRATLGSTYSALGLARQAIPLQEKARDHYFATKGPEYPATLGAMHNLAKSYFHAGRRDEALEMGEEVLALRRKVNGQEHPDTILAMNTLALSYDDAGRRDEALQMQEEVLALSRKVLGAEHPNTLGAMSNLANSYDDAGRRDEALKLREEVLALRPKAQGAEHPETLSAMHNLAISYADAGRGDEALKMCEEVLALRRKVNGPEHPGTLDAMHNLAASYDDAGRGDEALEMREEMLLLSHKVNGPEHPDTLRAMHNLAKSYFHAGRRDEALKLREEVLALRRKVLGTEHPDTLPAMNNLAVSYDAAGRKDEALKMREKVLALRRKVHGAEHPDTLSTMSNLANSYDGAGRKDEALKMREEVLALRRKVLGAEHPDTLRAMNKLPSFYGDDGRKNEALQMREEVLALQQKHRQEAFPPIVATLVPADSEWKWLHPADGVDPQASDPDFHTTFFAPDHDDSGWKTGTDSADPNGGFGYGRDFTGLDIGTPENPDHRHSAYFRHRFTTDKLHASLELRCRRDDALVVYLDGREVVRDNLPDGPDTYLLSATVPQGPDNDGVIHRFPLPGSLEPGEHVLSISVHNAAPTSSDLRLGGVTLLEVEDGKADAAGSGTK